MHDELTQTFTLAGRAIFAHCAGSSALCLSSVISLKMVTLSPFLTCATTSPLSPAWPRTFKLLTQTSAGPGTKVIVGSVNAFFFGAALAMAFFLALTGVFFAGAFDFVVSGGVICSGAGAGPAAGAPT